MKNEICFNDFKISLFEKQELFLKNRKLFKSEKHDMHRFEINKKVLLYISIIKVLLFRMGVIVYLVSL